MIRRRLSIANSQELILVNTEGFRHFSLNTLPENPMNCRLLPAELWFDRRLQQAELGLCDKGQF